MLRNFILILILSLAASAQVPLGATKQEILATLGQPISTSGSVEQEILNYPDFAVLLANNQAIDLQLKPQQATVAINFGAAPLRTSFAYYPSFGKVQLIVELSPQDGGDQVTSAAVVLRRKGNTASIASTRLGPFSHLSARLLWDVPPLSDGDYEIGLTFNGIDSAEVVIPFVRYQMAWERNALGKSDMVVPPFTPIQIDGTTIRTILRNHTVGPLGLWNQVESLGRNLLASPMRLELTAGGKTINLTGASLKIENQSGTHVVTQSEWSDGNLQLQTTGEWDYDGMMKWTLNLTPATATTVDSLILVIPLQHGAAPLFHAITPGLRRNYAGATPVGEGRVWDGTQALANPIDGQSIIGNYIPYVWLGAEERGLSVFGENDRGWVNAPNIPCQELVRRGDVLELRLNLIARPTVLNTPLRIRLGFEATPVKPMPQGWRSWAESYLTELPSDGRLIRFAGSAWSWGAWTPCLDLYPINEDFKLFEKYGEARRTGVIDEAYLNSWVTRYAPLFSRLHPDLDAKTLKQTVHNEVHYGAHLASTRPHNLLLYTNARGVRFDTREGQTYLDEWNRKAFSNRLWTPPNGPAYDLNPSESYRDYAMWYYKKMKVSFADSIYWDDIFLQPNFNVVCSDAYELPDGQIQPSAGLFDMRQLIRRTAILDQELGLTACVNQAHFTNTAIAPILAFAQSGLTWEDRAGNEDYQDRFTRDYIRAESIGRQFGNPSFVLNLLRDMPDPNTPAGKAKHDWLDRTFTATILVHELRAVNPCLADSILKLLYDYGYGGNETQTFNYWDDGLPVTLSRGDASHLIVTKPGSAIIVVSDFGEGGEVLLTLDRNRLGLDANAIAVDIESNLPVETTTDGNARIALKKHDFKVIKFYTP